MSVAGVVILSETVVIPGTNIVVQSGNDNGAFGFNVKEITTSTTRDVNVVVSENQKYTIGLTKGK